MEAVETDSFKPGSKLFEELYSVRNGSTYFKTFITGEWVDTGSYMDVKTPIDLSVIARVSKTGWELADKAMATLHARGRWSARDLPGWRRVEVLEKAAEMLEELKEDFVNALMINSGKTRSQAQGEVLASIDRLRAAHLDARKIFGEYMPGDWDQTTIETEAVVRREPVGIVLAIIPFNYPLFDTVSKITYSFIAGNAVAVKPPSADPLPVLLLARVLEASGFPSDALAVLTVPGSESDRIIRDDRVGVVSFTGSSETGKKVVQKAGIKQLVMELGGGDPAIVLGDADVDFSAERVAMGIYSYSGQRCDAIKLVLVKNEVYGPFKKALLRELSKVRVGDPRDPSTTIGPLIEPGAVDEALKAVEDAVEKGGVVLHGGRRLGPTYMEPTLVEFRDHGLLRQSILYWKEVFAPVALITGFNSVDEAVSLVNERRYGLDAAVFGQNMDEIRKLVRFLEVGAVYVNDMPRHGVGYYPYGGRKDSGIGREGVGYSIEYTTSYKTIIYNYRGKGVWKYTL
ncbi:aldehyde dehydrogenase family protein [Thermosphaera chiliense]|uniref:Aldehyde dehydrogenase family protein n=1 Tax=Thermosphaera chiliense TaxID=3402707 RepID=A0A7M1UQQ9_9CREN|nr:NADP-dependent glyceraldehyde-3-phosphate dehydrogenase [Thermosphaera aggregans]QOR94588.1 aldehyde dehydrogenase family protein [Thermosphaera aggregans]